MSSIPNPGKKMDSDDVAMTETVSGHATSFAQRKNKMNVQNDRISIMEMGAEDGSDFSNIIRGALDYAAHITRKKAMESGPKDASPTIGSTTVSMVAYDPKQYRLDVASIDDSPGFFAGAV